MGTVKVTTRREAGNVNLMCLYSVVCALPLGAIVMVDCSHNGLICNEFQVPVTHSDCDMPHTSKNNTREGNTDYFI